MSTSRCLRGLPGAIREALVARSQQYPVPTLDDHVAWLASQGYKVWCSSVGRFLQRAAANRAALKEQHVEAVAAGPDIRLGCLMVAATIAVPGDRIDLLNQAERLLEWTLDQSSK